MPKKPASHLPASSPKPSLSSNTQVGKSTSKKTTGFSGAPSPKIDLASAPAPRPSAKGVMLKLDPDAPAVVPADTGKAAQAEAKKKSAPAPKKEAPRASSPAPAARVSASPSPSPAPAARPAGKERKPPLRIKGQATAPSAPSAPARTGSGKGRRILFVTAECTPIAQTGGLGDAVAGLSKALCQLGHDARIVMPLYGFIDRAKFGITYSRSCCVHFGQGEEIWVGVYEGKLDNEVPVWFIDYARYFDRRTIYGDPDDAYRYGVLSKAALQVCKDTGFIPEVAHVHDWMSAMSAVFLKTWDRVLSPLSHTASVLTIHNIGYQGKFDSSVLNFYGLGGEYMRPDRLEDFGAVNLLKAGIQYADAVTTVSPSYAREIREPIGGMGLAPYLNNRAEHVFGILNGVDTKVWNPEIDKFLPARYSRADLSGKAACKKALQERFGLTVNPKLPIFGIVSRFAPQKGFDLLRGALPQALRDMHIQVVVLGTGDPFTENFFRWLAGANPGRANAHIGFAPEIAHLIEAGSDFFLMPSIYEPCGLNQMYSSLYGTLPVVRATGGLDDTVDNYDEGAGRGTGFKFWEISGRALYFTIGWAVSTWYDRPQHYRAMQEQGMAKDFTWAASAREYLKVYDHAIAHRAAL